MNSLIWAGIAFCISQSALFSGLNLAVFGISRLQIEVEASTGNRHAIRLKKLRSDPNLLLTTILWGNVGINVLLTLLSRSVLAGVSAFLFSTIIITFLGEMFPQAYFSRHSLKMASALYPVLRFYQVLLYPVAKPAAMMLDAWLGKEGIRYYREKGFREMIKQHMKSQDSDVDKLEGTGALNFLEIDDIFAGLEGENIHLDSVVQLEIKDDKPVLPDFKKDVTDPFLKRLQLSKEKWVFITDLDDTPRFALDADGFIRGALFDGDSFDPYAYIRRPIIVTNPDLPLGQFITQLEVSPEHPEDDVVDNDIILVWSDKRKKVITGADILGRLLRGITTIINK